MKESSIRYFLFFSAISVFIYLIARAVLVPIVHDEAASFFHYLSRFDFIPGKAHSDANNHLLNSFLSGLSIKAGGNNLFFLRFANLIFFPVFAIYLYRTSQLLPNAILKISFFLSGLMMHGITEFFAYSRGYAMSMALLMGTLFYALRYFMHLKVASLILSLVFLLAGISANLSLLTTAAALFFIFVLHTILIQKGGMKQLTAFIIISVFALLTTPFIRISFGLKNSGLLYYGDDGGFVDMSLASFSQMLFGSSSQMMKFFWIFWFIAFLLICALWLFKHAYKLRSAFTDCFIALLFLLSLLGVFVLNAVFGVNYPSDRTGMHLVLLLSLSTAFLLRREKAVFYLIPVATALIFSTHFLISANLKYSTLWKCERMSDEIYEMLRADLERDGREFISIGGYHTTSLIWAWYNYGRIDKLPNLNHANHGRECEDYYIFKGGLYSGSRNYYDSLYADPYSGITLGKRKSPVPMKLVLEKTFTDSDLGGMTTDEYIGFFESVNADTFSLRHWRVELSLSLQSPEYSPLLHMVCSSSDSKGGLISYQASPLHHIQAVFDGDKFRVSLCSPADEREHGRFVVYLWNQGRAAIKVEKAMLRIYLSDRIISP